MRTDDLEQYGRRHSLRISGIPESHKEHTDMLICEFLKDELNIEINMGNIDRSHRVGQKKPNLNKPIAVRFINYRLKEHVYAMVPIPFKTGQKPKPNEQEPAHKSKNNAVIVTEVQVHSNPEPCTVNNGGEEIEPLSSTVINTSDNVLKKNDTIIKLFFLQMFASQGNSNLYCLLLCYFKQINIQSINNISK